MTYRYILTKTGKTKVRSAVEDIFEVVGASPRAAKDFVNEGQQENIDLAHAAAARNKSNMRRALRAYHYVNKRTYSPCCIALCQHRHLRVRNDVQVAKATETS